MKPIHDFYQYKYEGMTYRFLPSGDIFDFTFKDIMMNQFQGNPKDGSINNIYLRIYDSGKVKAYPLLGIQSSSDLKKGKDSLEYVGNVEGISYRVIFRGSENHWFWEVELEGNGQTVDLLYGQDIGDAPTSGVLTNELYISQYLGHQVYEGETGYVICSRQNQDCGGERFPYIQQGVLGMKAVHYSTDGLQFFGTSYKESDCPMALEEDLPDVNYQFEFSYIGLQTEKVVLDKKQTGVFYGLFQETKKDAVTNAVEISEIAKVFEQVKKDEDRVPCEKVEIKPLFGQPYASPKLDKDAIKRMFPEQILVEEEGDTLLSFFTTNHSHVVTGQKEVMVERPHGTIITTFLDKEKVNSNLITSTNYMYGLFNGQTVIGNTSFHKFLSAPRGLLNIQKNAGQRIYVKIEGTFRLLTLPALYEMGMNYSRWYYVLPNDMLIITSFTAAKESTVILEVKSQNGNKYDYIVTNQLVLGEFEHTKEIDMEQIKVGDGVKGVRFAMNSSTYPDLGYDLLIPDVPVTVGNDSIFFADQKAKDETFLTLSISEQSGFQCVIKGYLEHPVSTGEVKVRFSFEEEYQLYMEYYKELNRGFSLTIAKEEEKEAVQILNETAWWYSHNAMVHFAVPHGLEQPGGAAWGTRDVCQGPMEYFLATGHYELAREVLLNIFAHQDKSNGEWPQWFMFDRYTANAGECHGDVVFWPLKSIGDYLRSSGDYGILEKKVPYADAIANAVEEETVLEHIKIAFEAIKERFIGDTGLVTYAGGDWDDTLQPANPAMKEKLVSAWTVALSYQVIHQLGEVLQSVDEGFSKELLEKATLIEKDFNSLLIQEGVISGFVRREEKGFVPMLHPLDKETGIHYRLLPMTRSIIAELVDKEQAKANMDIIEEKLKCPDGVRLMDCPASYEGGVSRLFKRAEQAANVGREVSLQYTHAHIRYLEACGKLGEADKAWEGLFTINPIQIRHAVANACMRQSNLYFSSSEGAYMDRYEYARDFYKLREGSIPVKGGWRLYSSGPGIYLNQLISNILGIRFAKEGIVIDPVLPKELDGLEFHYTCFDKAYAFRYHIENSKNEQEKAIKVVSGNVNLEGTMLSNPYRRGGILIGKEELERGSSVVDIYL